MKRAEIFKAEPFDTMQYFYRTAHDPLVRCLIRMDGHIDEEALKRALTLSSKAIPLIFCRFNNAVRKPRWEVAGYSSADAVHVLEVDGEAAEEQLLAKMTVDILHGPQIIIAIARRPDEDALCIAVSHLVCDGGGFKEYLYLLCSLYGKCKGNLAYDGELKRSPRGMGPLHSRLSPLGLFQIFTSENELGKQKNGLIVPMQGDAAAPFIAKRVILPDDFAKMRLSAKKYGATVNDMLLAAYARALSRATGEKTLTIPCPVDLRKYLGDGEARICNLTSNLICEVEIGEDEPFEATLLKVTRCMAAQKDSTACLKGPLLYGLLYPFVSFRWLERNFSKLFTIPITSFTNLGVLDAKLLRFAGTSVTQAYMTAAIKRVPYFQITASTFEGCCTLTCNLYGTAQDRADIERFLEDMGNELAGKKEK